MSDEYLKILKLAGDFLRKQLVNAQQAPLTLLPEAASLPRLTQRDEANVLTAYAFRNGFLEDIHAGFAGFSDDEMKKLMIEASANVAALLHLRQVRPELYAAFLFVYRSMYCQAWTREDTSYSLTSTPRRPCPQCREEVRAYWKFCPSCGTQLQDLSP